MSTGASPGSCPRCGAPVAPDFRFCPNCGLALSSRTAGDARMSDGTDGDDVPSDFAEPAESSDGARPFGKDAATETISSLAPPHAERRQLTVMFCDIVGSVALSLKLDPEDLRDVVQRYQRVAAGAIERYEGYIAQYLGDGILAYFGYPIAHEDEAERAVRAGRDILAGIELLSTELREQYGLDIAVRVGLHTGLVVVGEVGSGAHRENLALGDTPNVAARLQGLAPENALVASEATYRLVTRTFEGKDLGRHLIKGTDREERVFRIVDERVLGSSIERIGRPAALSTAGRQEERAVFDRCWQDVENGHGQLLFLHGEPGIGKSHLVRLFRDAVRSKPHRCVDSRCSPYFRSTPFHPFTEWLRDVLNFYPEQSPADRLETIEFVARRNGLSDPNATELLAGILSVPLELGTSDLGIAPSLRKVRSEDLLAELFLRLSEDEPLLLIVEDLHWSDPTTRSFLQRFAGMISERRVLILLTSRPRPEITWDPAVRLETLSLHRLSRPQVESVIKEVSADKIIPHRVLDQIVEKTDGIPLFVQELTRMVLESEILTECEDCYELADDAPELAIPTTLHDSLMARLDRLLPVKEVAQICSILGREFSFELAQVACRMNDVDLATALNRLVEADLLHVQGSPPQSRYTFRHVLIQEAAYESMLRSRRQKYHERVAEHLIDHPELEESRSEIIAFHLTRALLRTRAAHFWRQAAEEAYERWANEEAVDYFTRGLALVESVEATEDVRRDRFFLQAGLAVASMQLRGYTHPSVLAGFEKALAYSADLADRKLAAPAIRGIWAHYTVIGDHKKAESTALRLADLAATANEPLLHVDADLAIASTAFWRGNVAEAADRLENVLESHSGLMESLPPTLTTQHPRVGALSYLAIAMWYLGYPDRAEQLGREAVEMAARIRHPFSSAFALGFYSLLETYFGNKERVLRSAEQVLEASSRYGFPFWTGIGTVLKAWATSEQDPDASIAIMKRALSDLRRSGVQIWTSYPSVLLADILVRRGDVDEGLATAEAVARRAAENDEGYFLPELMRIHAKCLHEAGRSEEADETRRRAIKLAHKQQARPIMLRILLDLGDAAAESEPELETLLHTTVASFSESLNTPELTAAREMARLRRPGA